MNHASLNGFHRMYLDHSKLDCLPFPWALARLPHASAPHNAGSNASALGHYQSGSF